MNKIIQNKRIITFVLLLLGLPVIFIAANSVQNYLSQATLENATLTLPTTMTTQVGQEFDLPLFLNTDGAAVRGVDISILFDHTRLTLMTVVPTAQSTTPFKTFTPLTSGNTFASAEVVTAANQTGKLEFSAITFDITTQTVTSTYTGTTQLALLRFKALQSGQSDVTISASQGMTTDSNIVKDIDPPIDLLSSANQVTNTTVTTATVSSPTPTTNPGTITPTLGSNVLITNLILINATTDSDIGPLTNGQTLNLATLPSRSLNIRADTNPTTVGSVRFTLDGTTFSTENTPVYAMAGNTGTDYNSWTPSVGTHTLTVTPYTGAGATGTAGTPRTLSFTVVDQPTVTNQPSLSPSPAATSTPIPNSTRINVAVFLHGIGKAGDNANPSGTGNQTPLTPKRNVTVFVYDSSNNLVMSPSATLMYQSTTGNFTGTVDLGSSFTTGQYLLKIKVPTYLRARVPGIVSLTANQSKSISDTTIVAGDANSDNVLNILDYNLLLDCYSELNDPRNCDPAKKTATDLTDDGNVNQFDYNLFLRELSVQSGE